MSTSDLQLPPNSTKLTTVTPTKGAIITPSTQTTVQPLPPTVSAQFNSGKSTITVQGTVLIDAAATISTLDIYQGQTVVNTDGQVPVVTLELYVVYNYTEEIPASLYPYDFNFQVPADSSAGGEGNYIAKVELFLWDEDPVGSRGTTTTVKPPQ